jgi:tRNA nucleotidyltransferase (CCA-adding enzyme)
LSGFAPFLIELIVAYLFDRDGTAKSLEEGLQRFYLYVAQSRLQEAITFPELGEVSSFPNDPVVVLDPVNKDNNVAARLTNAEREEIVNAAELAFSTIETAVWKAGKGETLDLWKEVMGRSFTIDE